MTIELDAKQQAAVELGCDLTKRIVAISGPAGSGKTTIIKNIYDRLRAEGKFVAVAAPTGKAARRIREATGIHAVTVHKLLEFNRPGERNPETGEPLDPTMPKRRQGNPLDQSVVLVDEYAMVSHGLNRYLIDALPSAGCLRCIGDVHQLPPIEEYKVKTTDQTAFEQHLARAGASVQLTHVYRQDEGSDVLLAATNIRSGRMPTNIRSKGFYTYFTERPVDQLLNYIADNEGEVDFRDINNQILTPVRVSWIGTIKINPLLKNYFNPHAEGELLLPREPWASKESVSVGIGDKVICTNNTYDMRPFFERFEEWTDGMRPVMHSFIPCPDNKMMLNGETGVVVAVHPDGAIEIDFGDRVVEIPASYEEYWAKRDSIIDVDPRKQIDLAYAITVHKAQGSEFNNIIYLMNKSAFFGQSRQNLYTAVTRAKSKAVVITDQRSLASSLRTVKKN